jgi:hypothetical protein
MWNNYVVCEQHILQFSQNLMKLFLQDFTSFSEKIKVLLSWFYYKVTSRISSFPYKSIEFFVNLLDVARNGP